MKLNMSKFKKISSDKHNVVMEHDDGHTMTIALKSLSPKMQAELEALPVHMAKGGQVKKYAEGGDVPEEQKPVTININSGQALPQELMAPPAPQSPKPVINPGQDLPYGITPEQFAQMQEVKQQAPVAQPQLQAPQAAPQQAPVERQLASQPAASIPKASAAPDLGHAYQQELSGINQEAKAQGDLGQQQADILKKQVVDEEAIKLQMQQNLQASNDEFKNFMSDYKEGHIDPKRYLNSMGTGAKISTAIGLILGGFGSGLTHTENQAAKFLNDSIDRDVEAQKAELGKKQNLLSANMQHFNNINDAIKMTQLQQSAIVADKLRQAAATAATPMAKSAALKAAGDVEAKRAPEYLNFTTRQALMKTMAQGGPNNVEQTLNYMRMVNPEMAKDMESRYVPGVGLSAVPVPNEVRGTIVAKQQLGNMAQDFYDWSKKHSGSLSLEDINVGKTKAAELQSLYRNAINGGVFKKGEQEFIDQIVDSDPTKFFNNVRVLPKLQEVIDSNHTQLNTLKQGYGLPSQAQGADREAKLGPQEQQYLQWARKNPNDPKAAMVLKKLGIK